MALTENERFIFSVFYLQNCCDTSCLFFSLHRLENHAIWPKDLFDLSNNFDPAIH